MLKSPQFAPLWERYDVCERGGAPRNARSPIAPAVGLLGRLRFTGAVPPS
ncbi:hypothetical protein [Streptomyces sp. NPDC016172]